MRKIIDSRLIEAIRYSDQSGALQYLNNNGFINKIKKLLIESNNQFLFIHFDLALDAILDHMKVYNYKMYFAISDMVIATFDGSDDDYDELVDRATELVMLRNMAKALAQSMFEGIE